MITDSRVLSDGFLPGEIVHRDAEVQMLADTLEPLMNGDEAENIFLFGPTGVGKTCTSRYTLEQLAEQSDARYTYINCWEHYNRFRVLYQALDAIGETLDIHRQSTPKDELLTRLREADNRPLILILDEVDQLDDKSVLYDLHSMDHITLVMIANEEHDVFAHMDDRIHSRFAAAPRLTFEKYSLQALVDILQDRIEWGLHPGVIDDEQVEDIADAAAGDARIAISILRAAARTAEREGADQITADIIEQAAPDAREERRESVIDQLTDHQKALYDIIADAGEIVPRELYERYEQAVERPKSERTLRKYLNKMEHYQLIRADGEKRGRTYRPIKE